MDVKQWRWNQAEISQNKMVEDFISTKVKQSLGTQTEDVIWSNGNLLIVSPKVHLQWLKAAITALQNAFQIMVLNIFLYNT